ncbi:hypothetical protein GALMADRAFT_162002 [Galerina marginata CBS 339.88]|uniref:Uncharacterized protein n=1 Tax=Galerina marginata (strain CBS 339.88) TaxID=685588 RepID=A0A067S9H4_GALM3|nr:hypothetical protein GALMADRAFT_162002 [Galerina marginata CBS 339.88]
MRLLNVNNIEVEEFLDKRYYPSYAILSHTWGQGEVSLQDLSKPDVTSMAGYHKIEECCKVAKQDGFKYVWIDTCCIDKTSSTELSEAINSMHKWYEHSTVCYVYLFDMPPNDNPSAEGSKFSGCRWFTRGWTLQELLAPNSVVFYNRDWVDIGTKDSLSEKLSMVTSIPCKVLQSEQPLDAICIAQRMSWAAQRETTRVEDAAYSLMGVFNVNMPILYGEGSKAFIRLQLEIMKDSDDRTIFAWVTPHGYPSRLRMTPGIGKSGKSVSGLTGFDVGLIANSPQAFQYSQRVRRTLVPGAANPFSITNEGLHIKLPLIQLEERVISASTAFQAILSCEIEDQAGQLVIYLRQLDRKGSYTRIDPNHCHPTHCRDFDPPTPTDIYVRAIDVTSAVGPRDLVYHSQCHISLNSPGTPDFKILAVNYDQAMTLLGPAMTGCNFRQLDRRGTHVFSVILIGMSSNPASQVVVYLRHKSPSPGRLDHSGLQCAVRNLQEEKSSNRDLLSLPSDFCGVDRLTSRLNSGHILSITIRRGAPIPSAHNEHEMQPIDYVTIGVTHAGGSPLIDLPAPVLAPLSRLTLDFSGLPKDGILPSFLPTTCWKPSPGFDDTMIWTPSRREASALVLYPGPDHGSSSFYIVLHAVDFGLCFEFFQNTINQASWNQLQASYLHDFDNPSAVGNPDAAMPFPASLEEDFNGSFLKVDSAPPFMGGEEKMHYMWVSVAPSSLLSRAVIRPHYY